MLGNLDRDGMRGNTESREEGAGPSGRCWFDASYQSGNVLQWNTTSISCRIHALWSIDEGDGAPVSEEWSKRAYESRTNGGLEDDKGVRPTEPGKIPRTFQNRPVCDLIGIKRGRDTDEDDVRVDEK